MDISTGFRFHPIEMLLRYLIVLSCIFALGVPPVSVAIALGLTIAFNAWEHANVVMPRPLRGLQGIFVTPELHRVHHSNVPMHHDRNFGVVFSFWDRLFWTFYAPAGDQVFSYGAQSTHSQHPHRSLGGLFLEPLFGDLRRSQKPLDKK